MAGGKNIIPLVGLWADEETVRGEKPYWVYCLTEEGSEESGPCKIGVATSIGGRMSSLQAGNWRKLVFIWQFRVAERDRALWLEEYCLILFRPSDYGIARRKKLPSEWLDATPSEILARALNLLEAAEKKVEKVA